MKLQYKVLIQVFTLTSVLFGISAFLEAQKQRAQLENIGRVTHQNLMTNSIRPLSDGLWKFDDQAIKAAIDGMFEFSSVYRVQIIDTKGLFYVGKDRDLSKPNNILNDIKTAQELPILKDGKIKGMLTPLRPVSKIASDMIIPSNLTGSNRRLVGAMWKPKDSGDAYDFVGHLIVDYSTKEADEMIRMTTLRLLISGIFTVIGLSSLLFIFMKRSVISPILNLAKASEQIAKGNFDTEINVKSKDEIGNLANSFSLMRDQVKEFTLDLKKMVDAKTAQVLSQKKKIQEILNNLQQGIVTFDSSYKIEDEFSSFMCKLYNKKPEEIRGADVLDFIFSKAKISSSVLSDVKSSLINIVGENEFGHDLNSDNLIKEAVVDINNELHDLEFDWIPMWDDQKNVERMMLSVRDMTKQKKLEREIKAKGDEFAEQMKRISDMIVCDRFLMGKAFSDAEGRLVKARASIESETGSSHDTFVHLHTVKGNFRTLGIKSIAELVHNAEELVHIWRDEGKIDREVTLRRLEEVEKCFGKYKEDYERVFGSSNSGEEFTFSNMLAVVSSVAPSFFKLVEKAKLEFGGIEVCDEVNNWNKNFLSKFREIMAHGINNTIDHGHLLPMERGVNPGPVKIAITTRRVSNFICIEVSDWGAGLNVEALKLIAEQKNMKFDIHDPYSIIFKGGLSTAGKVTETSGRGVGMSALAEFAKEHKGTVSARGNVPHGMVVQYQIPIETALEVTPIKQNESKAA